VLYYNTVKTQKSKLPLKARQKAKVIMIEEFISGNIIGVVISLAAILIAITVHEFSHAAMADYLGDPTAKLSGRKSLNPLAHLDPIGTLMLLLFRFGWGKPVPVDPFNLRNPRRDQALVSLAGPGSNLILAFLLSIVLRIAAVSQAGILWTSLLLPIIFINVALAIFNLIPLGPLDGFKIVLGFLPEDKARDWAGTQSYGLIILMMLVFLPIGGLSIGGIVFGITNTIIRLFLGSGLGMVI